MRMRISNLLVGLSIATLATATSLPAINATECESLQYQAFSTTSDVDTYVRCAETNYDCGVYDLNSTVPAYCKRKKYVLFTGNFTGPLALPGSTELFGIDISNHYGPYGEARPPSKVTSVDLPDLVNITVQSLLIDHAPSFTSLNVPKLRYIGGELKLDFRGGPALNLSFPSLVRVTDKIDIEGEIDALDFPALETLFSITVNSTGNLDCDALGARFRDTNSSVPDPNPAAHYLPGRTFGTQRASGSDSSSSIYVSAVGKNEIPPKRSRAYLSMTYGNNEDSTERARGSFKGADSDEGVIKVVTMVAITKLKRIGHPVRSAIHKLAYPLADSLNRANRHSVESRSLAA
ncbi:hypothetical protein V492_00944 [Pseudogymnoascus sp. VKM F-4246]|nr:hypothetical protein V492_00944 [Pseudogymnoascus sp. VKM F-4246]